MNLQMINVWVESSSFAHFSFAHFCPLLTSNWISLVTQMAKNPPAMQEIQVWSLSQEEPLEKEMATHSSILVWEIPWV